MQVKPGRTAHSLLVLALLLLAPAAWSQGSTPEVWVVGECLGRISVIDSATSAVVATVDVSDPDGNRIPDPPSCIAFTADGTHALVTQGRFVTPVEVVGRTVLPPYDLGAALGVDVDISGCAAAPPKRFLDPALGQLVRSHVFLAATTSSGEALAVVLDQQALTAGTGGGDPLVGTVVLHAAASTRDVAVLSLPAGARHQRAYYTLATATELVTQEVFLPESIGAVPQLGAASRVPAATSPPGPVRPAAPLGGEFVVVPQGAAGPLSNPLIGGECDAGGEQVAVSVTGFGDNSYTVATLDRATNAFRIVDPSDCSLSDPIGVGSDPVALATLGAVRWERAYVVNRGSDDVTEILDDRSSRTIDLCPTGGPDCNTCPVSAATSRPTCDIEDLRVTKLDMDGNGRIDTYRVSWLPIGCASGTSFEVACKCETVDPTCPCSCDCSQLNPPPSCQCPGFVLGARSAATRGANALPLLPPQNDLPVPENPWIILGVTPLQELDHAVDEDAGGQWDYKVEPD